MEEFKMRLSQPKKIVFNICITIAAAALILFALWLIIGATSYMLMGIISWVLMAIAFGLLTLSVSAKGI